MITSFLFFGKFLDCNFKNFNWNQMKMIGLHNRENIACAAQLIYAILNMFKSPEILKTKEDIFKKCMDKLFAFKGLPHRMENLGNLKTALFVNDSKATTIESVLTAVKGVLGQFSQTQNLFLLLGGKDKNLPWKELSVLQSDDRIKPYFFGACAVLAKDQSHLEGPLFKSLEACLDALKIDLAQPEYLNTKNIVLLSPGGTSLDEFKSFEHRGCFFKEKVTQF
jgi:UDP-N-acetylmuramoylalanine--D-glutamate ligase